MGESQPVFLCGAVQEPFSRCIHYSGKVENGLFWKMAHHSEPGAEKSYVIALRYRICPNDNAFAQWYCGLHWSVHVVAAQRTHPLSKAELQTLRALVKRLMFETDRGKIRAVLEELTRIVEDDPQERRPN